MAEEINPVKTERIDNPDGTYTVKSSYEECDKNGWKSFLEQYDKNDNFLYGEYYQDSDFQNLGQKTVREIYQDGSYRDIKNRTIPDHNGWFIINELFDHKYGYVSGMYKTLPEDDTQIILEENWKFNDDGTRDRYCSYIKQTNNNNYSSFIEHKGRNGEYISSKFYKDRFFKDLFYSCCRENISENHYIDRIIEENNIEGEHYKSRTFEAIIDEKIKKERYYKNNDFTGLISSTYTQIKDNGDKLSRIVRENDKNSWCSAIFERDKQNNTVKQIWFVDKNMKEPYCEQLTEYQDPENYTCKTFYHKKAKEESYHTTKYYNNGKLTKTLYYTIVHYEVNDLNMLFATETYEYLPNGNSVMHTVFENKYDDMLSLIEYRNGKDLSCYGFDYSDKNFKTPFRRTWSKHIDNCNFRLKIYNKMQDGFNTEIEKLSMNNTVIYRKRYKVNFIIAQLLFKLAK